MLEANARVVAILRFTGEVLLRMLVRRRADDGN